MNINAFFTPKKFFLTKGIGRHKEKLTSLELALRDAKIGPYNIVKVSSIIPPGCKNVSSEEGIKYLSPGQIVFCVLSENSTDEKGRIVVSSVGVAQPDNPNLHGYLSEHHSFGQTEEEAKVYAEKLAAYMLATTLGFEFDTSSEMDEVREMWRVNGYSIQTNSISCVAECKENGVWTTVVAASVFIL